VSCVFVNWRKPVVNASLVQIPVLRGSKCKAWPSPGKVPAADYVTIVDALAREYRHDAHCQIISVPTIKHRLKKDAVKEIDDGIPIVVFMVDVDAHDIPTERRDAWFEAERPKLGELLSAHPSGYVYRTRGGYRIVYLVADRALRTDSDAEAWRDYYQRCLLYLARRFGIVADPACADWTRLFRLPHATRDGSTEPELLETIGDPANIGIWSYTPADQAVDAATATDLHAKCVAAHPGTRTSPWGAVARRLSRKHARGAKSQATRSPADPTAEMRHLCAVLAASPAGGRNAGCYAAARALAPHVEAGSLSRETVEMALTEAMIANGAVRDDGIEKARSTIGSGLSAGKDDEPTPRAGVRRVCDYVDPTVAVPPDLVIPDHYEIRVWNGRPTLSHIRDEEDDVVPVTWCASWISAQVSTCEGHLWTVSAAVDTGLKTCIVDRGLLHDHRKLAVIVEAAGIPIAAGSSQHFARYLDAFRRSNAIPVEIGVSQLGWVAGFGTFLLGRERLGPEPLVLVASERVAEHFHRRGSAERWRSAAESIVRDSSVAAVVLAASVASPMLRLFGWAPIGIALGSVGGGNKTTLLRLAASVFGSHGDAASRQASNIVANGNATALALVGQFASMPDLPHLVDELRANVTDQKGRDELEAALHQIIDGVERARMGRDGAAKRIRHSVGSAVVATETDVSEFLIKGGAVRRFLPMPAPYARKPLGEYIGTLAENYGHAGHALVSALVGLSVDFRKRFAATKHSRLGEVLAGDDAGNEALRTWGDQIAVALAASNVACQLCPDVMPSRETWTAQILECWAGLRKLAASGIGSRGDIVRRAYDETRSWLASMRQHLQPSRQRALELDFGGKRTDLRQPVIGRVVEAKDEGEAEELLTIVDVIQPRLREHLASRGYSLGTIVAEWQARGWLRSTPSRRGHGVSSRIGGTTVEAYRVVLVDPAEEDGDA
jgi:hypothetical protein